MTLAQDPEERFLMPFGLAGLAAWPGWLAWLAGLKPKISNCSVSSLRLIAQHFTIPLNVPIMCSFVLSINPSHIPSFHLFSSFGILTVLAGLYYTHSLNFGILGTVSLLLILSLDVLPSILYTLNV